MRDKIIFYSSDFPIQGAELQPYDTTMFSSRKGDEWLLINVSRVKILYSPESIGTCILQTNKDLERGIKPLQPSLSNIQGMFRVVPLMSRVTLNVGRQSRLGVVDSSLEFAFIISFQLNLGKLKRRLSSN